MKSTGYFGTERKPRTMVHVVVNGHPICGCRPKGEYQWCAPGSMVRYIECLRCLIITLNDLEQTGQLIRERLHPIHRSRKLP